MKGKTMPYSNRGFTLVELIVVMAMFVIVIAAAGDTFTRIMKYSSQQSRTAESNIEGVVGLEMMRKDLASAGFGLPWSFQTTISYDEVDPGGGAKEALAAKYNGTPDTETQAGVPSPVSGGNNVTPGNANLLIEGSDYLVLRATSLGRSTAAQRWSFVNYTGLTKPTSLAPEAWTRENLNGTDWVTVIRVGLSGSFTKELVMSSGSFTTQYNNLAPYEPNESKVTHYIYGIQDTAAGQPRMPFNRANYYTRVPSSTDENMLPRRCAPNTGILYKALVKNDLDASTGGTISSTEAPLLDCVADMQVVYTLDSLNNGVTTDTDSLVGLTARQIREQLRLIQVFVLTHEGGKDALYTYPNQTIAVGPTVDGLTSVLGRSFNLETKIGAGWQQYRWKIYRVIVKPANLAQSL